jgi:hypothetical protein
MDSGRPCLVLEQREPPEHDLAFFVSVLLGIWVVETALFVLSYRTSGRGEGSPPVKPL